jgi:hypothetical protein
MTSGGARTPLRRCRPPPLPLPAPSRLPNLSPDLHSPPRAAHTHPCLAAHLRPCEEIDLHPACHPSPLTPPFAVAVSAMPFDNDVNILDNEEAPSTMPVRPVSDRRRLGWVPTPAPNTMDWPPPPGAADPGPSIPSPRGTWAISFGSSSAPRLCPTAPPFCPSTTTSFCHSKEQRWADFDEEEDDAARPSFVDIVRHAPPPAPFSDADKVHPFRSSPASVRPEHHAGERSRCPRLSMRRGRRPSELVIGLPLRGRDDRRSPPTPRYGRRCASGATSSRIPVHQRLGPWVLDVVTHQPRHRRFSQLDADGWSKVPLHEKLPLVTGVDRLW